jgi:hypothetical protein
MLGLSLVHRYLAPDESLAEVLFGLIMALTITAGARLFTETGQFDLHRLVLATVGSSPRAHIRSPRQPTDVHIDASWRNRLSHDHDRTRYQVADLVRNATHEQPLNAAYAAAAHDQQIRFFLFGRLDEHVRRVAVRKHSPNR